jgi:predicted nucleic acid-binding protein
MILLDTDVMIDVLRGYEPAKQWLESAQEIGVPGLVAMELLGMPKLKGTKATRKSAIRVSALLARRGRLQSRVGEFFLPSFER